MGEGERERDSYLRATWMGVDGTEFEWWETMDGRCSLGASWGAFSSGLGPILFDVIGVLVGTTEASAPLFPSGFGRAGAGFVYAFFATGGAVSRCAVGDS